MTDTTPYAYWVILEPSFPGNTIIIPKTLNEMYKVAAIKSIYIKQAFFEALDWMNPVRNWIKVPNMVPPKIDILCLQSNSHTFNLRNRNEILKQIHSS